MSRQILAALVVLVLMGACGGQSTLTEGDDEPAAGEAGETAKGGASNGGSASGGVSGGGSASSAGYGNGYAPCVGKQCGDPCFYECPSGAACDPVVTYCHANGFCATAFPNCSSVCLSARDCPDVGVDCTPCPDGSMVCPEIECVRGTCALGSAVCPECKEDAECPVPPIACTTCDNGNTSCPMPVCWNGECQVGWSGACVPITPCSDLTCGAPCNPCSLPECPPLAVPHFCNSNGECETEPLGCFGQCVTATDCPPPPPSCGDCPVDTCLAVACVNGACEFVCR